MQYAIDEFNEIANSIHGQFTQDRRETHYLTSMIAELSYYHVQEYEFGDDRVHLVPYEPYWQLANSGNNFDLVGLLGELDLPTFVVSTPNSVAVTVQCKGVYFVGIRGSANFTDWSINFDASITPISLLYNELKIPFSDDDLATVHSGFMFESIRISKLVFDEIRKREPNDSKVHIISCGHSLGGALAALSFDDKFYREFSRQIHIVGKYIFGSPRYCSVELFDGRFTEPLHFWNVGDMVPTVPSKKLGYSDQMHEILLGQWSGRLKLRNAGIIRSARDWIRFLKSKPLPHDMMLYRSQLGSLIGAQYANKPLINHEKKF